MSEFTKAAERAAANIIDDEDNRIEGNAQPYSLLIMREFIEIAATYELLCELAKASKFFKMAHDNLEMEKALNRSNYNTDIEDIAYIGKAAANTELDKLLADPRIQRAIGGTE